jgi:hypothetical protein
VRYFKVTLLIGLLVSLVVAALYETGLLYRLDVTLATLLGGDSVPAPRADRLLQYAIAVALAFATAWTTIDIGRNSLKFIVAAGAFAEVLAAT